MSPNNNHPMLPGATDGGALGGDVVVGNWVGVAFQRDFSKMTEGEKHDFRVQYAELQADAADEKDDYVDDDMVAEWVGQHYQRNFDRMSEDEKQDYRDRFVEMHSGE
jgi:hypothetical protein